MISEDKFGSSLEKNYKKENTVLKNKNYYPSVSKNKTTVYIDGNKNQFDSYVQCMIGKFF